MKTKHGIARAAKNRNRTMTSLTFAAVALVGFAVLPFPAVEAATSPGCAAGGSGCKLFKSVTLVTDNRVDIVGNVWENELGQDQAYWGATITMFQKTDGYYQHHNYVIDWAQYQEAPQFLDRSPSNADHGGGSTTNFGIGLSGPTVGWSFDSGDAAKWRLQQDKSTITNGWHERYDHMAMTHSKPYSAWDKDTFGFSATVNPDGIVGVWLWAGVYAGSNGWNPPWHAGDPKWVAVQGSSCTLMMGNWQAVVDATAECAQDAASLGIAVPVFLPPAIPDANQALEDAQNEPLPNECDFVEFICNIDSDEESSGG